MIIKNNVHILPYSICEESYINNNVIIGPFARLRPKTIIEKNVKIGNFIEIKKSIIKKGTKANHLSYIGDAEIGENSNIGAGSVTCNYDGTNKHKAILKKGVFLGSNSTLISPITINKHAYIAAGSVLNKNVPKYSLAISRSKQINKKHYVKKIIKK